MSDSQNVTSTTGGAIGIGLLALGGVLAALIVLWLLVSLAGGGLRVGGFVLGLMLLAVLCLPLIGAGWYLRSWGRREIVEADKYAARREVLDTDVLIRRQLVREVEQRLEGIERLLPSLPERQREMVEVARRRLRDVRSDLLRPGYDATRWLNTGGGIDENRLATVRRYDGLVLEEANRLGELERALGESPAAAERLAEAVDLLAEHVREREQLFGRGRAAASMRPQELLAAGRELRRPVSSPLALSLNDAVTYEGGDYLVRAVLSYFAGGREWKSYQLHDGKQERWLEVRAGGAELAWLAPSAPVPGQAEGETGVITGPARETATVTIDSAAGHQEGIFVEYQRRVDGAGVRIVEQWPDGPRILDGQIIDRDELNLWTRPPAAE